jgi:hypothetical protein
MQVIKLIKERRKELNVLLKTTDASMLTDVEVESSLVNYLLECVRKRKKNLSDKVLEIDGILTGTPEQGLLDLKGELKRRQQLLNLEIRKIVEY